MLRIAIVLFAIFSADFLQAQDCTDLTAGIHPRHSDEKSLAAAYQRAHATDCEAQRNWLRVALAVSKYRTLVAARENGEVRQEELPVLKELTTLSYWRAWRDLGQLAYQQGDFDSGVGYYEAALDVIDNKQMTPQKPSDEEMRQVFAAAEETRSLAREYASPSTTRSGDIGGVFRRSVRGMVLKDRALPIKFKFDSAEFTAMGLKAVNDLKRFIEEAGIMAAIIHGHTDATGNAEYNMALGMRRAERVCQWLRQNGVNAIQLQAVSHGESMPPRLQRPGALSASQKAEAARRVRFEEKDRIEQGGANEC